MLFNIIREAKKYWHVEILGDTNKRFKWGRVLQKCKRSNRYRYIFWYRLAYVMHEQGGKFWKRRGKLLNEKISRLYNVEIMMGAKVGLGLRIGHPTGIVISSHAVIGRDFRIWQNSTIGIKGVSDEVSLVIGDGVRVMAHSCIIGDNIELGDNVVIASGSLVTKDVPANHLFLNERTTVLKPLDLSGMGRLQK